MELLPELSSPLFTMIIKMILIVLLMLLINRFQLNAHFQALLWRLALITLLALPCLHTLLPALEVPILPVSKSGYEAINLQNQYQTNSFISYFEHHVISYLLAFLLALISLILLSRVYTQYTMLSALSSSAQPVKKSAWLSLNHSIATSFDLDQHPLLLHSSLVHSPCTFGYFKPVILLPKSNISLSELRIILTHEIAHIKRNDWLWMMISKFTVAVFWFNPLFWIIHHKLVHSFEAACDEVVLNHNIKASDYAETLLQFHQNHGIKTLATSMVQHSSMYVRLNTILNPPNRSLFMKTHKQLLLMSTIVIFIGLITVSQLTMAHDSHENQIIGVPQVEQIAPHPKHIPAAPDHQLHEVPVPHPPAVMPSSDNLHLNAPEPPQAPEPLHNIERTQSVLEQKHQLEELSNVTKELLIAKEQLSNSKLSEQLRLTNSKLQREAINLKERSRSITDQSQQRLNAELKSIQSKNQALMEKIKAMKLEQQERKAQMKLKAAKSTHK